MSTNEKIPIGKYIQTMKTLLIVFTQFKIFDHHICRKQTQKYFYVVRPMISPPLLGIFFIFFVKFGSGQNWKKILLNINQKETTHTQASMENDKCNNIKNESKLCFLIALNTRNFYSPTWKHSHEKRL